MKVLGLTGGIGMGKTTVAQLLAARGVPVVDSDVLARELVEPGQPALAEIRAGFGEAMVGPDGRLRRDELARHVFPDAALRRKLEAILHPRIRERWQAQVAAWRGEGHAVAVAVIPLLFETGAESQFDEIVCVACSAATQQERLRARGWTAGQIAQRLAAQWPVEKKIERSHHVIWTEGDPSGLAGQLRRILD
jgi:dephospho-CoA kinase